MSYLKFVRGAQKSGTRKRIRTARAPKRFARSLAFLQLEDRWMLAGLLGTAEGFAVLAGQTVTNTGPTIITGNLGVSPGTAVTGFAPGIVVSGTIHAADAVAAQAQSDLTVAYNDLAGRASNFDLTGQDLGGLTLTPGVYTFSSSAQLTGTLTLDAQGDSNAEFIFQIGSTLTTASASSVNFINGADSCNVYWQVGSSATLGTTSTFGGNIVALTSITVTTNATILNGRALARNGSVTLDSNLISIDGCGSIAWEKRASDANPVLLAGATFQISPNPLTGVGTLTVTDGGVNDADGLANGILEVEDVLMGTYTVTETLAPPGYAIDDDPTRLVTISGDDFSAVIGVQGIDNPGNTDESDFHNIVAAGIGSIAWEKRDELNVLQGGATFTISPDPIDGVGVLTVVDNGINDANPIAGQILVNNVLTGSYIVTETLAPPGYTIDDDPTRAVIVTPGALNQVIGVMGINDPGNTDESDFHNIVAAGVGSIAWEKRDELDLLQGGATFTISPDPIDGVGVLTVVDNGINDANPNVGQILVNNVLTGSYIVTETVAPLGYAIDDDPTRAVIVTLGDLNQVIGVMGINDPGDTDESDFHNRTFAGLNLIVIGAGKSPNTPQFVSIIDQATGAILLQFAPYGTTFQGGVRVATGDLTGDGVDEIVTAPGPSIVAEVRVYNLSGVLLAAFQPYGPTFDGGVQIAIADVDGDGVNDIITVPSFGPAQVRVFRNVLVGGVPTFNASQPYRDFLAFPSSFIGGAVVSAADMGSTPTANGPFDNTTFDQRAEIVVGSGPGIQTTVKVFDVSNLAPSTPTFIPPAAGSFTPFGASPVFRGGVSLSVDRVNPDPVPDIVVGAGVTGNSLVDVWAWSNTTAGTLSSLSANGIGFNAFTDSSRNSPIEVAAQDTDGDNIADAILVVQGPGGTTSQIRAFDIISTSPLQVSAAMPVPGSFVGPYDIDAIENATLTGANPVLAGDYNRNGIVDTADYTVWRDTLGHTVVNFSGADGNGDGVVNTFDFGIWTSNFGQTLLPGSGSGASLPAAVVEPGTRSLDIDSRTEARSNPRFYDRNLASVGTDLRGRQRPSVSRPMRELSPSIDHRRNDLLLAVRNLATARLKGEAIDEFFAEEVACSDSDASTGAIDEVFELL